MLWLKENTAGEFICTFVICVWWGSPRSPPSYDNAPFGQRHRRQSLKMELRDLTFFGAMVEHVNAELSYSLEPGVLA